MKKVKHYKMNDIEIVVFNDGSTDNSSKIIKSFADKYKNILFIDEKEKQGVINARNMAIKAASGEYILPLEADDTIESTYVGKGVKILDANPNIGIVYCKAKLFGIKNIDLYLADKQFLERFHSDIGKIKKKYKKLFNILLPITIVELITIITLVNLNWRLNG